MGRSRQAGFTYIGLLVAVVVMGVLLTAVARVWEVTAQRERETQLLYVGHAFRNAIARYYLTDHHFPTTLQALVSDEQSAVPRHFLRRLYEDPMTGGADWTLMLAPDGVGIMGVASSSQRRPIKQKGFLPMDVGFADSPCYCSWQFIYYPSRAWRHAASNTP